MERLTIRCGSCVGAIKPEDMGTQGILRKLADYEDLAEQGRLLILPCAVGDEFYMFDSDCLEWNEYKIVHVKCVDMFIDLWEKVDSRVFFKDDNGRKHHCLFTEFSKNVFRTREEAEAALEKMKGEEHEQSENNEMQR